MVAMWARAEAKGDGMYVTRVTHEVTINNVSHAKREFELNSCLFVGLVLYSSHKVLEFILRMFSV